MVLIPGMHNLAIPGVIPMTVAAVRFVTVSITISLVVAMLIVTVPVSMTLVLGKNHAGT
jgi:hypothetical protein